MIYWEKAKSGRSSCSDCYKKILINKIRMVVSFKSDFGYTKEIFKCKKCGMSYLKNEIKYLEKLYKEGKLK